MSVPAQNTLLREYARNNQLYFKLPVNELFFPNCFVNLWDLLSSSIDLEGILMVSFLMLPIDPVEREELYDRLIVRKLEAHFVMESFVLSTRQDALALEEIFSLRDQIALSPRVDELLRALG